MKQADTIALQLLISGAAEVIMLPLIMGKHGIKKK